MSIIRANRYTDSYIKRPQPKGVGKFILSPSDCELKAIHRGRYGGLCHNRDLSDLQCRAVRYAINLGAKSWTLYPIIGDASRRMIVEFYNWPEIGLLNFNYPNGKWIKHVAYRCPDYTLTFLTRQKEWYWWYNIPTPTWWADPERATGVSKAGEMIDPRA